MKKIKFTNEYGSGNFYLGLMGSGNPLDVRLLDTLGFVLPGDTIRSHYDLAEAWAEEKGAIVLLGSPASDPGALAGAIEQTLLAEPGVRLVWIANPDSAPSDWICAAFPLGQGAEKGRLQRDVEMAITGEPGGYLFSFDKGLAIGIDEAANNLILAGGGARFGRSATRFAADVPGMAVELASLAGPAFVFTFSMPGSDALVTGLDGLGVGLWYSRRQGDGEETAFRYPLFQNNPQHEGLTCRARITPAVLLNPEFSRIDAVSSGQPTPYYTTWLRTMFDRAVLAKAGPEGFAMLFNRTQRSGFGLSPEGRFALRFSNRSNDAVGSGPSLEAELDRAIACGSSGTESIVVPAELEEGLTLELKAGYPAAARAGGEALSLASNTTTAWLRLSAAGELRYEAQPAGQAAMYLAGQAPEAKVTLMPYLPLQAASIAAGAAAPFLPLVPLAGLTGPGRDAAVTLETTAIAPARKAQLGVNAKLEGAAKCRLLPAGLRSGHGEALADEQFTAVTPRGLEASFTRTATGDRWDSVQIARLLPVAPGNSGNLRFAGANGIVDPLLPALLTSQQFLVVSDPAAIKPFFSGGDAKVTLADWEFLLDPDAWAKHGTILILKNTPVAMQALLGDLGAWTCATAFNRNPGAASRELLRIAAEARKTHAAGGRQFAAITGEPESEGRQDLRFFVETVLDSPEWNGFLFLNAGLGAIPADLAGMRAGVDPARLYAHHLGITQTPFTTLAELQNRSSSMFGLIRYDDTGAARGDGLAYGFRGREIGVRFADSDIRDFRATIELSFGPVFGQPAVLPDGGPAVSEMVGSRHRRGAGDTYTFTANGTIKLMLGSGPLSRVDLEQGEFVTMSIAPEPDGWTRTEFNFAGALAFAEVTSGDEVYDVLSFDELAFSDLKVRMEFRNNEPQKPKYTFSIGDLQLSEAKSKARRRSLYEGMPLKLGSLIEGAAKPDTLGNMNVQLPTPPAALPARWYGVTQVLDMGTLSDVAGAASLEARLLTAWGPAPGQYYVGLNISGPGLSGSASELSLLGVLKLKVYSLALRHREGQWTLLMHGMTLGVFGKTLPPRGTFEFYVFGIPDPSGSANSLGWYGAWVPDEKEKVEAEPLRASLAPSEAVGGLRVIPVSPRLRFRSSSPSQPGSKGD